MGSNPATMKGMLNGHFRKSGSPFHMKSGKPLLAGNVVRVTLIITTAVLLAYYRTIGCASCGDNSVVTVSRLLSEVDGLENSAEITNHTFIPSTAVSRRFFHGCKVPGDADHGVQKMRRIKVWRSEKPSRSDSITIVTQLSLGRLSMLANQCSVWKDRIAAVIYASVYKNYVFVTESADGEWEGLPTTEVIERLEDFRRDIESGSPCLLDIEFVVEDFNSKDDDLAKLYPVNALRNRAHRFATTEAILLLDVDFVPSSDLVNEFQAPGGYAQLMEQLADRKVLVLPAFETVGTTGAAEVLYAVKAGKRAIISGYHGKKFDIFSQFEYKCHRASNYTHWFTASTSYGVTYSEPYEPYLIAARAYIPWYDERFRGYYQNKISHRIYTSRLGLRFVVHPRGFVIHVPHPMSVAHTATDALGIRAYNFNLLAKIKRVMFANQYAPVTIFCKEDQAYHKTDYILWREKEEKLKAAAARNIRSAASATTS